MTIGAYLAINYLNLKIPDDISVIGFDNFPLANVVNPPLSLLNNQQTKWELKPESYFTSGFAAIIRIIRKQSCISRLCTTRKVSEK